MTTHTDDQAAHVDQAYLDQFARRIIADALQEATSAYWLRRANAFDNVGTPTCDDIAAACRNAAQFQRWLRNPDATLEAAHG